MSGWVDVNGDSNSTWSSLRLPDEEDIYAVYLRDLFNVRECVGVLDLNDDELFTETSLG